MRVTEGLRGRGKKVVKAALPRLSPTTGCLTGRTYIIQASEISSRGKGGLLTRTLELFKRGGSYV